jgi:hypothetical protein
MLKAGTKSGVFRYFFFSISKILGFGSFDYFKINYKKINFLDFIKHNKNIIHNGISAK